MIPIEELCEWFANAKIGIDCSGITEADALKLQDIFEEYVPFPLNNPEHTSYSAYIMFYVGTYPILGISENKEYCMWIARNDAFTTTVRYTELIEAAANKVEADCPGFDEIFD